MQAITTIGLEEEPYTRHINIVSPNINNRNYVLLRKSLKGIWINVDQLFIVTRHYFSQTASDGSGIDTLKHYEIYPYMTVGFDVHLIESCSSAGKGKGKVRYMKDSLDGLVMFVGLNDSFAVPSADFPHLKPDSIYFTDRHEDAYYSQCLENKVYGGHDVGIYDYKNEMVSSCYFPVDHHCFKRTNDPPPFWFTPTSIK